MHNLNVVSIPFSGLKIEDLNDLSFFLFYGRQIDESLNKMIKGTLVKLWLTARLARENK
jgi:hypothetical protein